MTDDKLTPAGEVITEETPVVAELEEAGVAPSPETADEVSPVEAEPVVAPAPATSIDSTPEGGKTEDELLFEAALANLGGDDLRRDAGPTLSKGERIEAKVIQVEKDRVFVDLGTKAEGVVPLNELTEDNVDSAVGVVQPGDTFDVIVLKTNSAEGNPIVSKRRADFDMTWHRIVESFQEGKVFEAQVVDRVKGGLVVDIGVRGFVPATHVGSGKLRNIEKYVGQALQVKIIEVDTERKKVVLSNKVAEGEKKEEVKEKIFTEVQPQDVLEGTVRRLTDYGAFVDLGGIDGLLHISEMSWVRIDHPREVLAEGQVVKVMVLRLDKDSGRVSLGLRQVLPDPWNLIKENYKLGQKLTVKVTRMVQSGAFVKLPEGAEAFLPLSEISAKRLKKPSDELEDGQEIEPTIIDLRPDERRMVLSLRSTTPNAEYRYDTGVQQRGGPGADRNRGRKPRRREGDFEQPQSSQRTPSGGATIGERLGLLKGILRNDSSESDEKTES
jgi:4-hydroxy-3-methylbut-2-enyl diphosphate reductase